MDQIANAGAMAFSRAIRSCSGETFMAVTRAPVVTAM